MSRLACTAAVSFLLGLLAARPAAAHPWTKKTIGLGVVVGEPTGLTLDVRPVRWASLELDVGFGTFDGDDLDDGYAHLGLLIRPIDLTHGHDLAIPLYLGVAGFYLEHGREADGENAHFGVRIPIGLAFEFRPPIQIFVEVAVRLFLVEIDHPVEHDHDADLGAAVGFRVS